MNFIIFTSFILAAIFTIFLARKLSLYADDISHNSKMNTAMVGLLLGGATSLPEITTSITSTIIDNPDLATGNVLGSNLFNLLILAILDIAFRKHKPFNHSNKEHIYSSISIIILSLTISLFLFLDLSVSILGIGLDTFVIFGFYLLSMKILSHVSEKEEETIQEKQISETISLKQLYIRFGITSVFILFFGSILTITGDKIAVISGLGASFVGSFLVAASTSLPEAVSVFIAMKLRNFKLAISSILGSNIFNILILLFTDAIYRKNSLLSSVNDIHLFSTLSGTLLALFVLIAFAKKNTKGNLRYIFPSTLIIVTYLISSYIIFVYS